MHYTAHRIGGLVMQKYCPSEGGAILEIGSLDVNGSLRSEAPAHDRYVGLDFESGAGVDFVVKPRESWPVEDSAFDLVMASSVFEHDSTFWDTFVQMCRKAKPGGHIYVSAPSNGTVHRYPQDCWRFYPDAAPALAQWALDQGEDVVLVESFIADQENDVWNDFCAIYRRGPARDPLNRDFVFDQLACANVRTWESHELQRPREATQDMLLIQSQREDLERLNSHIAAMGQTVADLQSQASEAAASVAHLQGIEASLASATGETETLRVVEQQLREALAAASARSEEQNAQVAAYRTIAETETAKAAHLKAQLEETRVTIEEMTRSLAEAQAANAASHARLLELEVYIQERQDDLAKAWDEIASQRRQIDESKDVAVRGSRA
jgi:SAM-dependent methyltransferase/beta-galactosidase beta subunit